MGSQALHAHAIIGLYLLLHLFLHAEPKQRLLQLGVVRRVAVLL